MFYWDSFWELSTTRHELGPIPWTAINDYAYRWGIDKEQEFDTFLYFIRGMDREFLEIRNKEIESKRNLQSVKKSQPKRRR